VGRLSPVIIEPMVNSGAILGSGAEKAFTQSSQKNAPLNLPLTISECSVYSVATRKTNNCN